LKVIVSTLHAVNPSMPVVINKVMPRGPKPDVFPEKIRQLNALYEEVFKNDAQVCICDTWSLFDDGTGSCKQEEFPDLLHPNAAGYAKWTEALKPIFEGLDLGK
jgi:lysophospholipase L1-like esterase